MYCEQLVSERVFHGLCGPSRLALHLHLHPCGGDHQHDARLKTPTIWTTMNWDTGENVMVMMDEDESHENPPQ